MLLNFVGKVLFRSSPPWQQRRKVNTMVTVLVITLCFAACVGGIIYWINTGR
jgi:hypothetical protein